MSYLLLIRHGESRWNLVDKFTGWVDVPLSENGLKEAIQTSKNTMHLRLDIAFTSHLERAHQTLLAILSPQHCTGIFMHERTHGKMSYPSKLEKDEIPIYTTWLLNERNYGLLQGLNKRKAAKKYGQKKVLAWRRGYNERPPEGESLHDVYRRVIPYFKKTIWPEIEKGRNVLVVAHGNTLRTIIKHIDKISDDQIANLELAPAKPFIYKFEKGTLTKAFEDYSFTRPIKWD